jgi:hypothetical protein
VRFVFPFPTRPPSSMDFSRTAVLGCHRRKAGQRVFSLFPSPPLLYLAARSCVTLVPSILDGGGASSFHSQDNLPHRP